MCSYQYSVHPMILSTTLPPCSRVEHGYTRARFYHLGEEFQPLSRAKPRHLRRLFCRTSRLSLDHRLVTARIPEAEVIMCIVETRVSNNLVNHASLIHETRSATARHTGLDLRQTCL